MTTSPAGQAGSLVLDAEALYRELLRGVRSIAECGAAEAMGTRDE